MSDASFEDLMQRYVDQRGSLSDGELDALIAGLRAAPERAVALREQLLLDDYVSQKLAFDRRNFLAQVEQRIADFERGEQELECQIVELRELAEGPLDAPSRRTPSGAWWKVLLGAAASLVLWFAVIAPWMATITGELAASIEQVQGDALFAGRAGEKAANRGQIVRPGERIATPAGGSLRLRFADGTVVNVAATSSLGIEAEPATGGKLVVVEGGEIVADVVKQPPGRPLVFATPHARATVLGTKLRLTVGPHATRLDVIEGRVELRRLADAQSLLVSARETGFAATDNLALHQLSWPDDRSAMALLFAGNAQTMQVRSPRDKHLLQLTELHARGAARAVPGALELRGGSFYSDEAAEDVLPLLKATGEFTLELVFRAASVAPQGLTPIVSFPDRDTTDHRLATNMLLGQDERGLVLYLRLDSGDLQPREIRLGTIDASRRTHLQLSYRSGRLLAVIDGRRVAQAVDIRGGFTNWKPETRLLIGNDNIDRQAWQGEIYGITLLNRFADEAELHRNRSNFAELYEGF